MCRIPENPPPKGTQDPDFRSFLAQPGTFLRTRACRKLLFQQPAKARPPLESHLPLQLPHPLPANILTQFHPTTGEPVKPFRAEGDDFPARPAVSRDLDMPQYSRVSRLRR